MRLIYFLLPTLMLFSCSEHTSVVSLSKSPLIPKPVSVTDAAGKFTLGASTKIIVADNSLTAVATGLQHALQPATGFDLAIQTGTAPSAGSILLKLENDADLKTEGYLLTISDTSVTLAANDAEGIFRGTQTLLQLFPAAIGDSAKQNADWVIPAGVIRDRPEFAFRGSMLDVSRHFFSVEQVKRFIDEIAVYKINMLHLHLSDDQGWRIEIKSWPNLTAHGGSTEVGGGTGGFYSQDDYKSIVAYAASKFITIIPEIDMPGHTNAALASYKELNCSDTAPALYTKTDVGFSTFCVKKPVTYKFIDDVIRELAAITPGPYIHVGGDESHATGKEDYITFVNKIRDIPKKYGKKMIGWEEIAQGDIDSSQIVQFWTDPQYATQAAQKGATMILSPANKVYLDMKYDSTTKIGQDWAARIEVDSSYEWSPEKLVPGLAREKILGVEAPLWTETIQSSADIEYMVFPRLIGVAEIGWSSPKEKDWKEYRERLAAQAPRLQAAGINFYRSAQVQWQK